MRTIFARLTALSLALACLGAVGAPLAPPAHAVAPQPKPVPTRWEFRVDPGPLRTMVVETEKEGLQAYYYFTYEVANTTDQDRPFAPSFEIATDLGEVYRSNENVPSEVPGKIIEKLQDPLLENELDILGVLPQGRENSKKGLVVWPVLDERIDEVTVYAEGFSGETVAVERPDTGEEVILRKTLMLRHAVPGSLVVTSDNPLERTTNQWVMR